MTALKKSMLVAIGLIFLFNLVSAEFTIKNHSIDVNYVEGDIIRGKIEARFTNQEVDSLFVSNFPGNITLLELVRNSGFQEGRDYNCTTSGCGKSYSPSDEVSSLSGSG